MPAPIKVENALLSVSDKTDLIPFAKTLIQHGIRLFSTGGTYQHLVDQGIAVTEISEYTQFPEMMSGRLKTLHPKVHGGILARRDIDAKVMKEHHIEPFDLVVVNLYPFVDTINKADCTLEKAVEQIDIGGPTMVRAAAKNHRFVAIVTDTNDYQVIGDELSANKNISYQTRFQLAQKAFAHTAQYDGHIATYLGKMDCQGEHQPHSQILSIQGKCKQALRYGENPHQQAAWYVNDNHAGLNQAQVIQGKPLSFNNLVDTDAALSCCQQLSSLPSCVIVKHANPCGAASGDDLMQAYQKAYQCDPTSAFGGIIAFNAKVNKETLHAIISQQFVEVIAAPDFEADALELAKSKENIRLLQVPHFVGATCEIKQINGGFLSQTLDMQDNEDLFEVVTKAQPTDAMMADLRFSWQVVKFVKSNAIVYANAQQTLGIGAGQMSRVFSAQIAALKSADANLSLQGAVMASDAFFPFRDGIDVANEYGIEAIIQPGGSKRDQEVIDACNEHGIAMILTHKRYFRH